MPAQLATIADAITTEINTLVGGMGWVYQLVTAERAYLHQFELKATPVFRASVSFGGKATSDMTRGKTLGDLTFTVTFSKRVEIVGVPATDNAIIDPLVATVEAIYDFFDDTHHLTGLAGVRVEAVEFIGGGVAGVYENQRLEEENVFWSQLLLTVSAVT